MKYFIILIFSTILFGASAQPTFDTGTSWVFFMDSSDRSIINFKEDTTYKIKTFYIGENPKLFSPNIQKTTSPPRIRLFNDNRVYIATDNPKGIFVSTRAIIIYENDTMVVDFIGRRRGSLDTINFKPGYYRLSYYSNYDPVINQFRYDPPINSNMKFCLMKVKSDSLSYSAFLEIKNKSITDIAREMQNHSLFPNFKNPIHSIEYIKVKKNKLKHSPSQPPVGLPEMREFIRAYIKKYSPLGCELGYTVIVNFTVDKTGRLNNFIIPNSSSLGFDLDKIAVEAIKNYTDYFIPEVKNGNVIESKCNMPIKF